MEVWSSNGYFEKCLFFFLSFFLFFHAKGLFY